MSKISSPLPPALSRSQAEGLVKIYLRERTISRWGLGVLLVAACAFLWWFEEKALLRGAGLFVPWVAAGVLVKVLQVRSSKHAAAIGIDPAQYKMIRTAYIAPLRERTFFHRPGTAKGDAKRLLEALSQDGFTNENEEATTETAGKEAH